MRQFARVCSGSEWQGRFHLHRDSVSRVREDSCPLLSVADGLLLIALWPAAVHSSITLKDSPMDGRVVDRRGLSGASSSAPAAVVAQAATAEPAAVTAGAAGDRDVTA
ncbi:hypothetical protein BKM31_20010 [[Actinomadura] parvosata subsp. kistnae]|uniref:Uncharacterized protein n=1 Tax=[Actinomadura] parvosata subsp. kistnae TaxID=1909395 RepID=A0A1U9ZZR8_9ACTN|nr:hypothetical protein BKM31_20010 [Nonomuraea sp. ATCC 55076]